MDERRIAWAVVDIETTGLDAALDVPLEFGIKLIDVNGYVFASREWLIMEDSVMFECGLERGKTNSFVKNMHDKSGLWFDLATADREETCTRAEFDAEVCAWLDDHNAPKMLGMMSNSTGSLDRPFTLLHFPMLNVRLGHRNIDMSSIRQLIEKLNPELWANLASIVGKKEDSEHRVMSDIDACILEYRTYAREFLITGDDVDI